MQIKNLTPREAEVYLFDEIGAWGDTAGDVVDTLRGLDVDHIAVKINSPGGDVFDGIAIMNILKSHPARVTTVVEGLAASAASFIAVGAGDEVVMMPHSQLMIHDAWGMSMGNAEDMLRCAEELNRASDNLAAIYQAKAGGDVVAWRDAMREESWFSADEAVEAGLADRVESSEREDSHALAAVGGFRMMNSFRMKDRKNAGRPAILDKMKGDHMDLRNEVAHRVGVPGEVDDKVLLAALDEALTEGGVPVPDNTAEELEAARKEADEAKARVKELEKQLAEKEQAEDDGLTVTVDAEMYRELQEKAAYADTAREKEAQASHEQLVQAAITEGRISAASKDRWLKALSLDEKKTTETLSALPKSIPRAEIGHGQTTPEHTTTVRDSAYEKQMAQIFQSPLA
jgi:endopeptidase Clp|nr:MAG TPA: Putative ATP dependent Clp protease [Caudoviricetes sp.]